MANVKNRKDYDRYEEAVDQFFKREGIENLSAIDSQVEADFSWSPCECCGDTNGGKRENCSGFNRSTKEVQGPYCVCTGCVYYATYGELDDDTMWQIEHPL